MAGQAPQTFETDRQDPDWLSNAAPKVEKTRQPISPSDLGGAKTVAGETESASEGDAKLLGQEIHLLLEHLPAVPADQREQAARKLLETTANDPGSRQHEQAIQQVMAVLDAPHLTSLFTNDALTEVEIAAQINGRPLLGVIDRLIVRAGTVVAVDFKSNQLVPGTTEEIPEGVLRQLGAYLAALEQVYPDRKIELVIVWTQTAAMMTVPHDIVRESFKTAATS